MIEIFNQMEKSMKDERLTFKDKAVYFALLKYANCEKIYLSRETIGKEISCSRMAGISESLQNLEKNNYIKITRRKRETSQYELLDVRKTDLKPLDVRKTYTMINTYIYINPGDKIQVKVKNLILTEFKQDAAFYSMLNKLKNDIGEANFNQIINNIIERGLRFTELSKFKSYVFGAAKNKIIKFCENEKEKNRRRNLTKL